MTVVKGFTPTLLVPLPWNEVITAVNQAVRNLGIEELAKLNFCSSEKTFSQSNQKMSFFPAVSFDGDIK